MNLLLLYCSQTGYTKRYAEWIAEEVETTAVPLKECTQPMLDHADLVIYGGSVHGGVITGESKLSKLLKKSGKKDILYFAVGIRPDTLRTTEIIKKNTLGTESQATLFYFRGGLDKEKLSPGDQTMLRVYRAMLKRRKALHPEDQGMIELLRYPSDFSSREQILPLIQEIKQRIQ